MLESSPCNICKSDNFIILVSDGLSNIVRCRKCGLIYRNPRKTKEEYTKIYHYGYYTPFNKEVLYRRKLDFFKRAVNRMGRIKPNKGRLLDLGCGFGHFLDLARRDDWDAYGIELSDYASSFAVRELKLDIFKGELADVRFADKYFDAVTMWNFLDHLHDPLAILKEVNRILKQDGLLVMRLPNMDFQIPGFKAFKNMEIIFGRPRIKNPFVVHNYGFSARTLRHILKIAGFKDIEIRNSGLTNKPASMVNSIFFSLAQLIFYISAGRVFITPTLEAWATHK